MQRSAPSRKLPCRWSGVVLSVLVMTPAALFAASASSPTSATKAPVNYRYVAETQSAADKQGSVTASGIRWQCAKARCTTRGPWPKPGVAACKALADQVGRIKSYGHGGAKLSAAQLAQCNAGLTSAQATLAAPRTGAPARPITAAPLKGPRQAQGGPQPEPPTRPGVPPRIVPNAAMSPATPGVGSGAIPSGAPGKFGHAPPRGAADEIRDAAAGFANRPTIDRVADYQGLSCARRDFVVTGRNFGSSAGSRRVMLMSVGRHTPIRAASSIYNWSDGRITAQLPEPSYAQPGQRYVVAIVDPHNNPLSNTTREIRVCPNVLTVSGDIRITNCGAGPGNVRVKAYRGGRHVRTVSGQGVPGNDFAIRYQMDLPPSNTESEVELRPELTGITCTGGGWMPDHNTVRLDYDHARVTQGFEYRVGMETRRIAMSIVSGLVQDAFRGTAIRINNYDPTTHRIRENDSFVRLSDALGGTERRFNIGPAVSGPRKYYINDINLASTRVLPAGNELRVAMVFESNGTELIGTCGQDGFDAGCVAGAPDVEARIAVDIYFTLDRYYSHAAPISLSFSRVRVVPNVDAQADGLCLALDFLCSAINDYRGLIRTVVQQSFMNVLDTTAVRDEIARALLPSLRGLRIGTLNSVRIEGGDLVLAYLSDLE